MKTTNEQAPYFFHQGTSSEAYRYLGCHVKKNAHYYDYVFRTWAPNADAVFLVSDICDWQTGLAMQRVTDGGVYEVHVKSRESLDGALYKFRIVRGDRHLLKGDPYAFFSKGGSDGASIITGKSTFKWHDARYLTARDKSVSREGKYLAKPINIYEVHLGSFARRDDGSYYTYAEYADMLAAYVLGMGYTHVELMPVMEHPFDGSWGYQVGAYYAPTSRFGTPDGFRYFVDKMHAVGIGVILDWVPAHFPKDAWGLYEFDGSPLYEYQGYDRMESRSWGTRFFDVGRQEVQSFLVSNALYWLREFHVDGLRVDAVASMLYLDYDRMPGEWLPNPEGTNKNLEAIAFFQKLNGAVFGEFPATLMIAEESTDWYGITHPVHAGGLGFNLKWNMGFANDFYKYLATDPIFRRHHHGALNFPIMYAFRENYVLPVSHDEVVHGKGSLIGKISGSYEDKFRQMRAALTLMMTYPGKKMLFMGTEFAQFSEWSENKSLEWFMLDYESHRAMRDYVRALNRFYLENPPLYEQDFVEDGFSWVYADESDRTLVVFRRHAINGRELLVAISFSGDCTGDITVPVEEGVARYRAVFASCILDFEQLNVRKEGACTSIAFSLPPFGAVILAPEEE